MLNTLPRFLICVLLPIGLFAQKPLHNAHAHNDHEHKKPLLEALAHGFTSVEADVHLAFNELYVVHDAPESPEDWSNIPTLEDLYLIPLQQWVQQNNGKVYPGYNKFFYLMIDFKTAAEPTYLKLKEVLKSYESILSVVGEDGKDQMDKPIKVFISGNRPIDELLKDKEKLAGLDGRPVDLEKEYPHAVMPVISDNYRNFLSWNGTGKVNKKELKKTKAMIKHAHDQGKLVRLWAAPDKPESWEFLHAIGVDLINTDRLGELSAFLNNQK
ncbi:MAG: phosphatidylinositol-specific phospholipase C/glycerophosphodiester phosphodiesterase family protein [Cyclobacteriaceae bacterium]|nr:phosphatidylinositol-specific phospholipase C/glycerophosphodiester phosphodiesterase family protein [Cyclobacteriaceae bacterium SS2]